MGILPTVLAVSATITTASTTAGLGPLAHRST